MFKNKQRGKIKVTKPKFMGFAENGHESGANYGMLHPIITSIVKLTTKPTIGT